MAGAECERCGAELGSDAPFCGDCGLRLDVPVIDVDLFGVDSDMAEPLRPEKSPPSRLSVSAGVAVAVGLLGLGILVF